MSKYVIKGMYWKAGDDIFIDTKNDDRWSVTNLADFIRHNIEENTKVTITIEVHENAIPESIEKFVDSIIES